MDALATGCSTRYDKLDSVFLAFIHLAVIYAALQLT